jgi:hypothetical protein
MKCLRGKENIWGLETRSVRKKNGYANSIPPIAYPRNFFLLAITLARDAKGGEGFEKSIT